MESQLVEDTRHLLDAAYKWEKGSHREEPLNFTLSYGSTLKQGPVELFITMPAMSNWLLSKWDGDYIDGIRSLAGFPNLIICLSTALARTYSTVALHLY
jgi:hypothetical protein